jgi:hypothetical protein
MGNNVLRPLSQLRVPSELAGFVVSHAAAIAQEHHRIGDAEDLGHAVRNLDDGHLLPFHIANDVEKDPDARRAIQWSVRSSQYSVKSRIFLLTTGHRLSSANPLIGFFSSLSRGIFSILLDARRLD